MAGAATVSAVAVAAPANAVASTIIKPCRGHCAAAAAATVGGNSCCGEWNKCSLLPGREGSVENTQNAAREGGERQRERGEGERRVAKRQLPSNPISVAAAAAAVAKNFMQNAKQYPQRVVNK